MLHKILIIFYFIITLVFLTGIALTFYSLSYLGYYPDKIISWFWLGYTIVIIYKFRKKRLIKIFSLLLVAIILLSIMPMAIPFMGIVNYFSTIGDYQQIKLSPEYRIERTRHSSLSQQRIYVYEKKGLLEKNICRPNYSRIIEKVLNVNDLNNSIDIDLFEIKHVEFISINKEEIVIEYQIIDKKKQLHHKLDNN